jgi:hypothetical protein
MSGDVFNNSFYPRMQEFYPENGLDFLVCGLRGDGAMTFFKTLSGESRLIGNAYEIFDLMTKN